MMKLVVHICIKDLESVEINIYSTVVGAIKSTSEVLTGFSVNICDC